MCTYVCVCACMCACIHAYAHTWIACTCVYCSASSGCLLDPPNLALPLPTTPPTVLILPNLSAYSTHVEGLQFLNLALHLFDLQTFVQPLLSLIHIASSLFFSKLSREIFCSRNLSLIIDRKSVV